jgi:hypothetical protein
VRRQHLICVDTSSYFRSVVKVPTQPRHACVKLASDESLAGDSEKTRPHRSATHLSFSRHKSARLTAGHRFRVPTISQLTLANCHDRIQQEFLTTKDLGLPWA